MNKLFAILICAVMCVTLLSSCQLVHSTLNIGEHTYEYVQYEKGHFKQYTCGCPSPEIIGGHIDADENGICDVCGYKEEKTDTSTTADSPFTAYENLVTKDEFQEQYEQAFNTLQPDYTKDFIYTYFNDYTEIYENGEDKNTTNNRYEYDADSQIVLYHHEFQTNDADVTPPNESYFWEYREIDGMLQFYDARTSEAETRSLGFDEFWEFARSRIPFPLFPNPYKLSDNKTYYIDVDKDGNTVFTLYSGDENDYSLCQVVLTGTEMICRTKGYTKEPDYEDITIDIHRVYSEEVTLTPISESDGGV